MDLSSHLVIISTIIFILLIWFKTDALAEYGNLLRIKFFVKYFKDRDARPELTLLTYLGINNRTSFIIKILICEYCLNFWMCLIASLFTSVIYLPVYYILSIFVFKLISSYDNH